MSLMMGSSSTTSDTTTSRSPRSSHSSSFVGFRSPGLSQSSDLGMSVSPTLTASSASTPMYGVRRQPSAIDLALEEERYADPVELIGLGLLEPRPRANMSSAPGASHVSMTESMHDIMSNQASMVFEGIFEVMERA